MSAAAEGPGPAARAGAAFAAVLLVAWGPALAPSRTLFARDVMQYWLPQIESFVRAIGEGSWPFWNPDVAFGSPMLADPGYQVLLPTMWLNLLLPPAAFFKVVALGHGLLAALGVRRLGRLLGLSEPAALLAGGLAATSGPFLSLFMIQHLTAAAMAPWVLAALEGLLAAPSARASLRLALACAITVLAGSADFTAMITLVGGLRIGAWLLSRPATAEVRRVALSGIGAGLLALGLSAPQWMPTLEIVAESGRSAMEPWARAYWSLHPLGLIGLLVPRLLEALPLEPAARALLFESREPFLPSLYLAASALPLALAGARSRRGPGRALLGVAVLFLLLALGRHVPVFGLLTALPGFSLMRFPVKATVAVAFAWALLAGRGLDALREGDRRRPWALPLGLAAAGVALAAVCWLAPSSLAGLAPEEVLATAAHAAALRLLLAAALLLAGTLGCRALAADRPRALTAVALLVLADAAFWGREVHPTAPVELLDHGPAVAAALRAPGTRVIVAQQPQDVVGRSLVRGPAGFSAEASWNLGLVDTLRPPASSRFLIAGSFDGDFTGLAPLTYNTLGALLASHTRDSLGLHLLRLASVTHVVSVGTPPYVGLRPLRTFPSVFREAVALSAVPDPLPRAYAVSGVRVAAEPEAYVALFAPDLEPAVEVVLPPPALARSAQPGFEGSVRTLERRMDRIRIEAELSAAGFVVLTEAWDPGWSAKVDGAPAPVLRANVLFRAVPVPAGRHLVSLRYLPPGLLPGVLVCAASLLAVALLAGAAPPRRRPGV
ncbi:MAG: YfhO family protein [Vicinamibacteria bacterium]